MGIVVVDRVRRRGREEARGNLRIRLNGGAVAIAVEIAMAVAMEIAATGLLGHRCSVQPRMDGAMPMRIRASARGCAARGQASNARLGGGLARRSRLVSDSPATWPVKLKSRSDGKLWQI